jgi:peptidoglycan/xylan/chitin deacetylase (PgdA/CDA1 family)
MAGLRSQLFRSGLSALWFSGVARAISPLTAGKGAILMLHRVQPASAHAEFAPNAALSVTPEYLDSLLASFRASGIDVVSLDEALRRLTNGKGKVRRFVCCTLDDGYRDNLEHALPVFQRHGAPFTVYAASSFVQRTFAPWWSFLEHVIAKNPRVRFRGEDDERCETWYDTLDVSAKYRAFAQLSQLVFWQPVARVRIQLLRLAEDYGPSLAEWAASETCDFAELRALRAGGAEIGCHTVSHALLVQETDDAARRELLEARAVLEAGLGCPVNHLAYPYGKPDHVGARELRMAKELGFASATTTRKGALFALHSEHRHALPRVEVTSSFESSPHYLQTILSGLPLWVWNGGRRAVVD